MWCARCGSCECDFFVFSFNLLTAIRVKTNGLYSKRQFCHCAFAMLVTVNILLYSFSEHCFVYDISSKNTAVSDNLHTIGLEICATSYNAKKKLLIFFLKMPIHFDLSECSVPLLTTHSIPNWQ